MYKSTCVCRHQRNQHTKRYMSQNGCLFRALQCVAVRCSVLQCVAVRCSTLQCIVVRYPHDKHIINTHYYTGGQMVAYSEPVLPLSKAQIVCVTPVWKSWQDASTILQLMTGQSPSSPTSLSLSGMHEVVTLCCACACACLRAVVIPPLL